MEVGNATTQTAGRTYTLGANTTVTNVLTIGPSSGSYTQTLNMAGKTLTLSGTGTPLIKNTNGAYTPGAGDVINYTGNGATNIASMAYRNLQIGNATTQTAGRTYTLAGDITAVSLAVGPSSGSYTQTLADGSHNITLTGTGNTFTINSKGAYSATGTMTYTGSSVNIVPAIYNNLTLTAPQTATFSNGNTTTINNAFNCTGSSGNIITIDSDLSGTQATISKQSGIVSCSYTSLQDSNATGGATWNAYTSNGNADVSGNSGWNFTVVDLITPTTTPVVTPTGSGGGGLLISPVVNIISNIINNILPTQPATPSTGSTQVNYPPISESVPKEPQVVFQGGNIISQKQFDKISILPLPEEIKNLALKFPSFASTLEKTGISKPEDINKLKIAELSFPGLSEAQKSTLGIPSNITFARTGADNIDFNIKVSISDSNKPVQSIATVQNKPLYLTIKPDSEASSVKGYVIFKSANSQSAFLNDINRLSGSLSASILDATILLKKTDSSNTLPEVTAKKDIVLSEFNYINQGGIWTAKINSPNVDGKYEIRTVVQYKEKTKESKSSENL